MTLRPSGSGSSSPASAATALDYEIAREQASALGRCGRALEAALAALSEYDRTATKRGATRATLVQRASNALWRFMVQREACGLRDPGPVIRDYGVPLEVQNRMGIW